MLERAKPCGASDGPNPERSLCRSRAFALPSAAWRFAPPAAPPRTAKPRRNNRVGGKRRPRQRRHQRGRRSHIGRRLGDSQSAGDIEIDIVAGKPNAAMRLQHGQNHRQTAGVPADHGAARRAERRRRDQRLNFHQQRPGPLDAGEDRGAGAAELALGQKQRRRIGDFAQARPVISNTPISSVGPKRFLIARRMRNCCEPSPSNDSTVSTICSTTRGPAIWPSLVTWPTRMTAVPRAFGEAYQLAGSAAHLGHRAGGQVTVCPHGLDRIDHQKLRRLSV